MIHYSMSAGTLPTREWMIQTFLKFPDTVPLAAGWNVPPLADAAPPNPNVAMYPGYGNATQGCCISHHSVAG